MNSRTLALLGTDNAYMADATHFMQSLRQAFVAENVDQFFIADALKTVAFDGSYASFKRLDQMFVAFKQQFGVLSEDFMQDPRKRNSLLLIASHIGAFICEKLDLPEYWQSNQQMKNPARNRPLFPNDAMYAYTLKCKQHTLLPIQFVIQQFCELKPALTICQEIEASLFNMDILAADESAEHSDEMHAIQCLYQQNYPLFCGSVFQELLKLSKLDYSLPSLERFDDLMRELRHRHIVHPEHFLQKKAHFYFLLFLAGYLARVIAQEARSSLCWLNNKQINHSFQLNLPDDLGHCRIALIGPNRMHIMQHICEFLFSPQIRRTSKRYAQDKLSQLRSPHYPMYVISDTRHAQQSYKTSPYCSSLYQAGHLTAQLLQQLHGVYPPFYSQEHLTPTSYPAGSTVFRHEEGLDAALKQFNDNNEQHAFNVLGYKTTVYLAHQRYDGIALKVFSQGKYPLQLELVVPYISNFDYRGFHILQPFVHATQTQTEQKMAKILAAIGAFFEGISDFEAAYPQGIRTWQQYYLPDRYPYPVQLKQIQALAYI